jgi:epoxyqueuosine reductase QueG
MAEALDVGQLTEQVKQLARAEGAALLAAAPVQRFDPMPPVHDAAPAGSHPRDFLPEARSVISIAMPILNAVLDAPAVLADREMEMIPDHAKYEYLELFYDRVGHFLHDVRLEFIAQSLAQFLLAHGHESMIFPTTGLHPHVEGMTDLEIWETHPGHRRFGYTFGPFSHRHAATRAGLGEFGYNNVVLTPEFGARQRFNSIVTEAELVPDSLVSEPICLRDECLLCQRACIAQCITLRNDPEVRDYRSLVSDDLTRIFIDTPAKTDPRLCRRRREGIPDSPVRGDCLRICPLPREPRHLPKRLQAMMEEWQAGRGSTDP